MNDYTGKITSGNTVKGKKSYWVIVVIGAVVFEIIAMSIGRVYYQGQTDALSRQISELETQIERKHLLLDNYMNQKESLCSAENIKKKIKAYKMALAPRNPEQVVPIKRSDNLERSRLLAEVAVQTLQRNTSAHLREEKMVAEVLPAMAKNDAGRQARSQKSKVYKRLSARR